MKQKYETFGKRPDSVGLFWNDPKPIPFVPVKPEPTWLEPDWLPNLDKAKLWNPDLYTLEEMRSAEIAGKPHVFDIEHYPGYFLIMFKNLHNGKICYFEKSEGVFFSESLLRDFCSRICMIGFNSINYDIPMLRVALSGGSFDDLSMCENMLIRENMTYYQVDNQLRAAKIITDYTKFNHIDLIQVAPLSGSLKEYGARMHTKHMQDLPFEPAKSIVENREDKIAILRYYCENDLTNTEDLYHDLKKDISLREDLGSKYGLDLRSKSDAQIAEKVIVSEIEKIRGVKVQKPDFPEKVRYTYDAPSYLNFKTKFMQDVLEKVKSDIFSLSASGSLRVPYDWDERKKDNHKGMKFTYGETTYKMGIGGLHSCEANRAVFTDKDHVLIDRDVASYYPFIILNLGLYPENLGVDFLSVYRSIVERRLHAKKTGNKREADSLKITINGAFGKLGNMWSALFSPKLLLQVTLTGQLSLLYLIEKIEMADIRVVSANTDGIVIKCPKHRKEELDAIVKEWEIETNFDTEETQYLALLSQSVNSYLAVKTDMQVKGKGSLGRGVTRLFKNPVSTICITAIENYLSKNVPLENTIRSCDDIREFVSVRKVKGGGVQNGEFLGKCVRWYYSTESDEPIIYAASGNKVATSEGGRACMLLPDSIPLDLDYDYYINQSKKILEDCGWIF